MKGKGGHMSFLRKLAVTEGRAMVRVRYIDTHDLATIGVCPVCWNMEERRKILLKKLDKMGLEVVHKNDTLDGVFRPGKEHAPGCHYGKKKNLSWNKFSRVMKKFNK